MGDSNMYCGAGSVPKGKERGTAEYCVQTNQIRYYGIEAIDETLLQNRGKGKNIIKEKLKLKKIEDDAKLLIKDVSRTKMVINSEKSKPSERKKAEKKLESLMTQRDKLVKKLKSQKAVVEALDKEEALQRERESEATKKKSTTRSKSTSSKVKTKNYAGSKTSKKKR